MLTFTQFGAGRIGAIHAANLAASGRARLKHMVGVNAAAAESLAARHGARASGTEAALADPEVGAAGDIDSAMVLLGTAGGRLAHINNSRRASYGYDQCTKVHGSLGRLIAGNRTPTTVELADANAVAADKPLHFLLKRYADAYRIELNAFLDAAADGTPMPVGAEDGRQTLVLADASLRSVQEGRAVKLGE